MQKLRSGLNRAIKVASATVDRVRPSPDGVVVLAYHRIGGHTDLELDLDPGLFTEQMVRLAEGGLATPIDGALVALDQPSGPPAVAVTFDDGTADFVEHALPAIVSSGVPVTYYIATRFIEEQVDFPDNGRPLSWAGLAEAVSTGLVTVGSHTHSHTVLDKVGPAVAADELRRSVELIGDRLGVEARHFAYPKGVFGGPANEIEVAARFQSAALANCNVNRYGATDPLRLDRSPIQRSDGMHYFELKVRGGMALEGKLRSVLNGRRYRSASN